MSELIFAERISHFSKAQRRRELLLAELIIMISGSNSTVEHAFSVLYQHALRPKSQTSRATTVNRNIGYPRFRTHGSVSVRLFQISVRFRFAFF